MIAPLVDFARLAGRMAALPWQVQVAAVVVGAAGAVATVLALASDRGRIGPHTTFFAAGYLLAVAAVLTIDHLPRLIAGGAP